MHCGWELVTTVLRISWQTLRVQTDREREREKERENMESVLRAREREGEGEKEREKEREKRGERHMTTEAFSSWRSWHKSSVTQSGSFSERRKTSFSAYVFEWKKKHNNKYALYFWVPLLCCPTLISNRGTQRYCPFVVSQKVLCNHCFVFHCMSKGIEGHRERL